MRPSLASLLAPVSVLLANGGGLSAAQQRHGSSVSVPASMPTTRPLHRDVYGYSIEPVWVNDFISNNLTATLFRAAADVVGGIPPPIRVGGNTADQTFLFADGSLADGSKAIAVPSPSSARQLNITPSWFAAWGGYFPHGTNLTYALNLRDETGNWATAVGQAEAAHKALGSRLVRLELGNEVDHFINKGWRNSSWGVVPYTQQFRLLTDTIRKSDWYRAAARTESVAPAFAAGSFADPPWVPDQQDQIDDMDILNLTTRAGLINEANSSPSGGLHIDSYVVHMYPMSTCDPGRWRRMRLNLLSNHTAVWLNTSQYIPQAEAANGVGRAPLVMGETNSVSCGGRSGISDTFGAALWGVDYTLSLAAVGAEHVYFHLGAQSEYASVVPLPYTYKNESLQAGIRPGWYAHYFISHIVRPLESSETWKIAALPGANASDFSGFAVFGGASSQLKKLVFLDMGVWNGTQGLGNPSTISAADNIDPAFHATGARPVSHMTVTTPWCAGWRVGAVRLTGPGTNAKSGVEVSGVSFDPASGAKVGEMRSETLEVGEGGVVEFSLTMAEGVLLELGDTSGASCKGTT